jgi:hypothetical protein
MEFDLHTIITKVGHILEILTNLHVLALLIINTTRTPQRTFVPGESYSFIRRIYRLVELLAGLVTPLAKK